MRRNETDHPSAYEALAFDEQCKIFFESPYRDRGELLLRSQDPARLAAATSCEELYLMTRDLDVESRSELLRYANLQQLFFLSDLDCWREEAISTKGLVSWLEVLEAADRSQLTAWLSRIDYEMLVAGFQRLIRVYKPMTEFGHEFPADELLGDQPYFTFDHMYYVCVDEENFEPVRRALEALYEDSRPQYVKLLEGCLSEMDYEMEESARERRQNRLAERGFPGREEALTIYRPVTLAQWGALPLKQAAPAHAVSLAELPNYPVLRGRDLLFLDTVFALFAGEPAEVRDGIYEEFVWLSNKVLACEGIYLSSEERVKLGVERVRSVVSVALEALAGHDPQRGLAVLKTHWVEHVFRYGFSRILDTRARAEAIRDRYWKGRGSGFIEMMNEPYRGLLAGLLRAQPQLCDSGNGSGVRTFRDFKSLQELQSVDDTLGELARLHAVLHRHFPKIFDVLAIRSVQGQEGTLLATLVPTLFANFVLKSKPSYHELSQADARLFVSRAFKGNGRAAHLRAPLVGRFLHAFLGQDDSPRLRAMLMEGLQELEAELAGLRGEHRIDRRFVSTLWLKVPAPKRAWHRRPF